MPQGWGAAWGVRQLLSGKPAREGRDEPCQGPLCEEGGRPSWQGSWAQPKSWFQPKIRAQAAARGALRVPSSRPWLSPGLAGLYGQLRVRGWTLQLPLSHFLEGGCLSAVQQIDAVFLEYGQLGKVTFLLPLPGYK